ncbi:hypothetical protein [Atlantibacter sp. RC6]|uniref:hypothetical protein n=1 Tax=Atlantibacter sp. RC6 TaxID=2587036 RepID=UPI0016057AEC|nr:hypothetical protein [Atlantibacter sp. RC6]MBB3324021.1 hypothetical protein [Atlantibacter sp. RC6]
MTHKTHESVASYIYRLAKIHHVSDKRDHMSRMAVTITALADDAVELDNVEQLLINLKRKGVLSKAEILALQARYFREQRNSSKKLTA